MQTEVLRRLRHGGQRHVRVEHVHISDGGQAVIGNVKNPDAGEAAGQTDHLRFVFFFRCPLVLRSKRFRTSAKRFRLTFN